MKKKNLSKNDLQDVSIYESSTPQKTSNGNGNKLTLKDIPIKINCLSEKQKDLKKAIESNDLIVSSGPAGTGKTYLSLLVGLHLMKTNPVYHRLVMVKSLTTKYCLFSGSRFGYL